jgi:hypothetical protein
MERSHARNHHRLPLVPNPESNRGGLSLGYLISCSFHPFRSSYTTQTTTLTAAGSVWLYAFVAAAQPKPTYITDGRYSSFGINDCEKVHRLTDSSSSPFSTSQVWALTKATTPSQNRLLASDSSSPTTFSSSFHPNKPLVTCPHPPSLRPISPNSLPKTIQSLASPDPPKGQNTINPPLHPPKSNNWNDEQSHPTPNLT